MMSNMERERRIGAGFDAAISLLIIGNGFDLHHGLATSYSDYHKWLKVHDKQVVKDFDSLSIRWNAPISRIALTTRAVPPGKTILDGAFLKNHSALNGTTFVMKLSITRIQI